MRLEEHLERSARNWPDKTALVSAGTRSSYAELNDETSRFATALHDAGVRRGDRVIIFADNAREAVVALYATSKAGALFSIINHSTKAEKLAFILSNCTPTAIVTQAGLSCILSEAIETSGSDAAVFIVGDTDAIPGATSYSDAVDRPSRPLSPPGIELDLAMLIYTSGSTGVPKGVMMTHRSVDFAAWSITTYLENTPDDVILCALPISFDYGLYQVLMSIRVGATLVLEKNFTFPQAVLNRINDEHVTGFPVVPTMAALLLQMRDLQPGAFPSLRYMSNTAAALPPSHVTRLQELFPNTAIYSMYGLTECKRCTWLPPSKLSQRADSVGKAIPGTEAFVVDDNGQPVAPGIEGELVIRGPHLMRGYWNNPQATERALRPGPYPWEKVLYTGDLFRADKDGYLYFIGRKDDIIKTRGEKVSPKEVENVLYMIKGVHEAVVVGVDHPLLGSAIRAYLTVEPDTALDTRSVVRFCAKHLEDFMVPSEVHFVDDMPKTTTGKISRRAVLDAAQTE